MNFLGFSCLIYKGGGGGSDLPVREGIRGLLGSTGILHSQTRHEACRLSKQELPTPSPFELLDYAQAVLVVFFLQ